MSPDAALFARLLASPPFGGAQTEALAERLERLTAGIREATAQLREASRHLDALHAGDRRAASRLAETLARAELALCVQEVGVAELRRCLR